MTLVCAFLVVRDLGQSQVGIDRFPHASPDVEQGTPWHAKVLFALVDGSNMAEVMRDYLNALPQFRVPEQWSSPSRAPAIACTPTSALSVLPM